MDTVIPDFGEYEPIVCAYGPRWDIAKAFGWPPGVRLERTYTSPEGRVIDVKEGA